MLYREIMAVCSEIHTKHINTVCGLNVGLLSVAYQFILMIQRQRSQYHHNLYIPLTNIMAGCVLMNPLLYLSAKLQPLKCVPSTDYPCC